MTCKVCSKAKMVPDLSYMGVIWHCVYLFKAEKVPHVLSSCD